jgi:hypothetical protein
MQIKRTILYLTLGACAVDPNPTNPDDDLLPDGSTGVERLTIRGKTVEWPWVAKHGMKYVEDDFSIGPARRFEPELATPDTIGEWPGNHVPYCIVDIGSSIWGLTSSEQTYLDAALAELARITPLHFDRFDCNASNPPARYVDYRHWATTDSNETTSGIGHAGYTIQLTPSLNNPSIWHETGHALGYMHEQRRSDRASYVNFYPSCLSAPTWASQYAVTATTLELTPYDIDSIMEYSSRSFSVDYPACPPLLFGAPDPSSAPVYGTYNGTTLRGTLIAQPVQWSAEDINGAYELYEPALGVPEYGDQLGATMVSADFDGDGYDDLAVAAVGEQPGSSHGGAVFLYKGTMNGLVAWKVLDEAQFAGVSTHANDEFGVALASGDVDGDGIDDLIIGAPGYAAQTGAVFVYKGGRGGTARRSRCGRTCTRATRVSGSTAACSATRSWPVTSTTTASTTWSSARRRRTSAPATSCRSPDTAARWSPGRRSACMARPSRSAISSVRRSRTARPRRPAGGSRSAHQGAPTARVARTCSRRSRSGILRCGSSSRPTSTSSRRSRASSARPGTRSARRSRSATSMATATTT